MQQWIDLNNKVVNDSLVALKQLSEINMRVAESLFSQQNEIYDNYKTSVKGNVEKLSAAKDQQGFLKVQNEIFQETLSSALSSWKNTMAVVISGQEEYSNLAEETARLAKSSLEQVAVSVKDTTEAVEKSVMPTAQ